MSLNIWELKIFCSFVNPDVEEKEECERFWEYDRCPQDKGGGVGMGWVWKGGLLCTKLTFARVDNAIANGHTTPSCQSWRRCLRKFTILPNFTAIGANFQPPPLLPRNNSGVVRLMIRRGMVLYNAGCACWNLNGNLASAPWFHILWCQVLFHAWFNLDSKSYDVLLWCFILRPTSHNAITLLVTQSELG